VNKKLTIALGAAVLGVALIPATARASTPECTNGTYAGYCGTQADNGSPVLVMDVKGLNFNVGNPVIGWTNSSTDPATDWFQLPYKGDPALGVMFFATPTGVNLDLCVADPGNGRVVLRQCNGSNWQRWIATQVGSTAFFTWTNRATHRILTAHAKAHSSPRARPRPRLPVPSNGSSAARKAPGLRYGDGGHRATSDPALARQSATRTMVSR
jgi:hypothetical protein